MARGTERAGPVKLMSVEISRQSFEGNIVTPVVAVVSLYEFLAITTRKTPTISRITWNHYPKWYGKFATWMVLGWLVDHLVRAPMEETVETIVYNITEDRIKL